MKKKCDICGEEFETMTNAKRCSVSCSDAGAKKWRLSEARKASNKKYRQSEKGRAAKSAYANRLIAAKETARAERVRLYHEGRASRGQQ